MKKSFTLLTVLLSLSCFILAGCICSGKKCSSGEIKKISQTPSLYPVMADGDMISGFTTTSGAWAKSRTIVSTNYDKEKLSFRFKCFTEQGKKLKYGGKKSDDMEIFGGENVEIFLCTEPETGKYYQFAVNPDGVMYSAIGKDPSWEPENVKVKTEKKKIGKGKEFILKLLKDILS